MSLASPYLKPGFYEDALARGKHRDIVGGRWEETALHQMQVILDEGLERDDHFLDIGCGCLRLGHMLGTQTVAEGVETEAQMHQARRLGSERVQGFFTARPMPLSALKKYISSRTE